MWHLQQLRREAPRTPLAAPYPFRVPLNVPWLPGEAPPQAGPPQRVPAVAAPDGSQLGTGRKGNAAHGMGAAPAAGQPDGRHIAAVPNATQPGGKAKVRRGSARRRPLRLALVRTLVSKAADVGVILDS